MIGKSNIVHTNGATPKTDTEQVFQFIRLLYNDLPKILQDELGQDDDFMANIGFKNMRTVQTIGFNFDPDEFIKAAHKAINGQEITISNLENDREFKFSPFEQDDGKKAICINEPDADNPKIIASDNLQLLLESPSEREAVLRRNQSWFDCPKEEFEKEIAEIVSTEDPAKRIEKAELWSKTSAVLYYNDFYRRLKTQADFHPSDLRPPSSDGLLRHYRLTQDVASGSNFTEWIDAQAHILIQDEGLKIAFLRFSGLPTSLPTPIVNAISDLSYEEKRALFKDLLRTPGSPLSHLHLIHLLVYAGEPKSVLWRLANRIIRLFLNDNGKEKIEAFISVLNWTNETFNYWSDTRQLPGHIRLALVWAHTHELICIFSGAGASHTWLKKTFQQIGSQLPSEMFDRQPDYWFDIIHPRRVNSLPLALNGLAYSIGKKTDIFMDEQLQELFLKYGFEKFEDILIPKPALVSDSTRSQNSLNSFLGGDRSDVLSGLMGKERVEILSTNSLESLTQRAIEGLNQKNDEWSFWAQIHGILDDFPPYENLSDQIRDLIQKTAFADLYAKDAHWGNLALHIASIQAMQIGNEQLYDHLKSELLKIAEVLESQFKAKRLTDEEMIQKRENVSFVMESALNISIAMQKQPSDIFVHFSNILGEIIQIWKSGRSDLRFSIQRFCEELPASQAKDFWPLLIRLRAE